MHGKTKTEQYSNPQKFKYSYGPLTEMGLGREQQDDTWVVDEDKLGIYECKAKNDIGEAFAAIDVFRKCEWGGGECFSVKKDNEN